MPILPRAQRRALAAQSRAQPMSVPAPITGWNTRDALDEMPATDAVLLDNWYPDAQGVVVRNGFAPYATGLGASPVRTLAEHAAGSSRKFIAAASGRFYNISAPGRRARRWRAALRATPGNGRRSCRGCSSSTAPIRRRSTTA